MFFRKKVKHEDDEQKRFSVFISTTFGFTDDSVKNLFLVHYLYLKELDCVSSCVDVLFQLSKSEYFNKVGRKPAAYALYCLFIAEHLSRKQIFSASTQSLVRSGEFYKLASNDKRSLDWLFSNMAVTQDCWLFLKSQKGQFASLVLGADVLHVDELEDDVSDFDLQAIQQMGVGGGAFDVADGEHDQYEKLPPTEGGTIFDIESFPGDESEILANLTSSMDGIDNSPVSSKKEEKEGDLLERFFVS